MENGGILNTTGFVSRRREGSVRRRAPERHRGKRRAVGRGAGVSYVLTGIGVCALAFSFALFIKLKGGGEALAVLSNMAQAAVPTGEPDQLGKLRFVELPGILDVFAPSAAAVVPANASGFESEGDGGGLIISMTAGDGVTAPLDGRVTAVGEDPALGRYVSVASDGDIEIAVYGLSEVCVEKGQPVTQRQKLGAALRGSITVRAWHSGRPLDAASLFGIGRES